MFCTLGSFLSNNQILWLERDNGAIIRFVIPVVFIIKPDWSVRICLTQLSVHIHIISTNIR